MESEKTEAFEYACVGEHEHEWEHVGRRPYWAPDLYYLYGYKCERCDREEWGPKERVLTFDCRHPDCEASHTISAYSWDWQRPLRIECFALERSHLNEITKVGGGYRINLIGQTLHEIFAEEAGAGEGDGSEGATEESPSASLREDAASHDPQPDHSRPSSVVPDTPVIRKYRIQVGKMWARRRKIRDE